MQQRLTDDEVRTLLREACQPTQKEWAERHGLSPTYVSAVLLGQAPGPAILEALGLRRVVEYEPADAPDSTGTA